MTIIRTNTTVGLRIEPDNAGNIVFIANNTSVMRLESSGIVDLSSARLIVPIGNTNTRSNVTGSFRFNNQSNVFEAFTGSSWINVSKGSFVANGLIVAGGGGGAGAGGGAGGLLYYGWESTPQKAPNDTAITFLNGSTYTITVGAGGASLANGSVSSITGDNLSLVAQGGGGSINAIGMIGGSGGGAGRESPTSIGSGTPGQGNPGGQGSAPNLSSGGGGGAGGAGGNAGPIGGAGGIGVYYTITGANVGYAGGGGGGGYTAGGPASFGGGAGGTGPATAGTVNTGGGGGGIYTSGAQAGGSGIVVIETANTVGNVAISAGLTYTTNTIAKVGYVIYRFTAGTGTISWS